MFLLFYEDIKKESMSFLLSRNSIHSFLNDEVHGVPQAFLNETYIHLNVFINCNYRTIITPLTHITLVEYVKIRRVLLIFVFL